LKIGLLLLLLLQYWGLDPGLCPCQASGPPLVPHAQSFLLCFVFEIGSPNFSQAAFKLELLLPHIPSSWDYRPCLAGILLLPIISTCPLISHKSIQTQWGNVSKKDWLVFYDFPFIHSDCKRPQSAQGENAGNDGSSGFSFISAKFSSLHSPRPLPVPTPMLSRRWRDGLV
jgi:hypothetical protein